MPGTHPISPVTGIVAVGLAVEIFHHFDGRPVGAYVGFNDILSLSKFACSRLREDWPKVAQAQNGLRSCTAEVSFFRTFTSRCLDATHKDCRQVKEGLTVLK